MTSPRSPLATRRSTVLDVAQLVPADIPSPSSGTWTVGPLSCNAYGLMIVLGVLAAICLFGPDGGPGDRHQ